MRPQRPLHSLSLPSPPWCPPHFLDFPSTTIYGVAFFILKSPHVSQLSFDIRSLSIHQVISPITLSPLPFSLSSSPDPIKGTQLSISLPDDDVLNSFFIVFSTSPSSSALQWLSPPQTFNKKTPFCLYLMPVSTRLYIFQGPSELMPPDKPRTSAKSWYRVITCSFLAAKQKIIFFFPVDNDWSWEDKAILKHP
ncbi:hypothetical protein V6Z11_D06G086800 [Gossypium hirsutum]|uniref:Leucine aminopeptidase isoform X2 n=1 Tax=Gossypium hirsutum TaxID=3635 RepID=A0A1U8IWB1_GOSHI|nr:leucine aminopeptidase-like isoform X2 [Gossypium hirsutum]